MTLIEVNKYFISAVVHKRQTKEESLSTATSIASLPPMSPRASEKRVKIPARSTLANGRVIRNRDTEVNHKNSLCNDNIELKEVNVFTSPSV